MRERMRLWIPLALVCVVVGAYAFFYELPTLEEQGASSFAVANTVGLFAVILGMAAAVLILRRTSPP